MDRSSALSFSQSEVLRELLLKIDPNGPDGFEGLVAQILEGLTGKPFLVAATGRQPTGDAVSGDTRISLQAKRYNPKTALDANKIAADFLSVRKAANHSLDVYVIALTRESAQLRHELKPFEEMTGVDIVVLADEASDPEFSALCVTYWPRIRKFFASVPSELEAWVAAVINDPTVTNAVDRTRAKIGGGLNTFAFFQHEARAALDHNFRDATKSVTAAGVKINLIDAVPRTIPQQTLLNWWKQTGEPNAYIEAQEGYGKSWVAAAFAEEMAQGSTGLAVMWLQSLEWSGCQTLEAVVTAALRTVLPAGDPRGVVYADKILRVWPHPVLLVLDGVNEHGCLEAAQLLLRLYAKHPDRYSARLRLLFTTRPLNTYGNYWPDAWNGSRRIPLAGFSDAEFDDALRRIAPDVVPASIPPNVRHIASVPRFFRLALRLRERLRDLGQLSKPVLLFADLLDKIQHNPAIKKLFAVPPEEVLAHLARHSRLVEGKEEVSHAHLQECFPDFARALDDLSEQRIILGRRVGNVEVNAEHVVLGFALHLLQLAEEHPAETETALRDRFATALEPNREDDSRTEALYVALLLTLLRDPPTGRTWREARKALLFLWCGGHNAVRSPARLAFWSRTDLATYRSVVESMFTRYLSGDQDTELMTPIAVRWREMGPVDKEVTALLENWLSLIYPSQDPDDTGPKMAERASFPQALSFQQLRLSFAAISILSLRPELSMIPALVRCSRSCRFCKVDNEQQDKKHKLSLKAPYENLGILLRWNYTETIVGQLVEMAQASPDDEALQSGLRSLAECLDLAALPGILQRKEPPHVWDMPDHSPTALIQKFREWVAALPSSGNHWPHIWELEFLAAHPDASLNLDEVLRLQINLSRILIETKGDHVGRDEVAEVFPHMIAWLARFSAEAVQTVAGDFWTYALRSENPVGAALSAPIIPLQPTVLRRLMKEVADASSRTVSGTHFGSLLMHLTIVMLIANDESVILQWFEVMLTLPPDPFAEGWRILPVPDMLERIATSTLADECWNRFAIAAKDHPEEPSHRSCSYWLGLYACFVKGRTDAGRKALDMVREFSPGHPWAPILIAIIAAANDANLMNEAVGDSGFRRHFATREAAHHFGWYLKVPAESKLSPEVRRLLPKLPRQVAADLLRWTNGRDEHLAFARLLSKNALSRVVGPALAIEPGYQLRWSRGHDDPKAWWHLDEIENLSNTQHSAASSVWGVDRGNNLDFSAAFAGNDDASVKQWNLQLNAAIARCGKQIEEVADIYLLRFHAGRTLAHWARHSPKEFTEFAKVYFQALSQKHEHYQELAVFSNDLLAALCSIDIEAVSRIHTEFFSHQRSVAVIDGAIPDFLYRVFSSEFDNQNAAIAKLRMKLIRLCMSDRDIILLVMAAAYGGTLDWLRTVVLEQFGRSHLAKERAFAVSLVAFAEADMDRKWLNDLAQSDSSQWVRRHAIWALRVHERSAIARRLWLESVAEIKKQDANLLEIAARLELMRPSLPPTAICWERPVGSSTAIDALVHAFWYRWQNGGGAKADRDICGRKPGEYARGQKTEDVARRMFPWWNPT